MKICIDILKFCCRNQCKKSACMHVETSIELIIKTNKFKIKDKQTTSYWMPLNLISKKNKIFSLIHMEAQIFLIFLFLISQSLLTYFSLFSCSFVYSLRSLSPVQRAHNIRIIFFLKSKLYRPKGKQSIFKKKKSEIISFTHMKYKVLDTLLNWIHIALHLLISRVFPYFALICVFNFAAQNILDLLQCQCLTF